MVKHYFVYILANKRNGTLYIGVTNNLGRRLVQHKYELLSGFTKKYKIHRLVYYEIYTNVTAAIQREKQLKWWKRDWKIDLIVGRNPTWDDLYETLI